MIKERLMYYMIVGLTAALLTVVVSTLYRLTT